MSATVWDTPGKDSHYEAYRQSKAFTELREWVDQAYYGRGLIQLLDPDFLKGLRDADFYARLWELELAEWLSRTGLSMIPTNGKGPDFCIQLSDGNKVWIEAVLAKPDADLERQLNNLSKDLNDLTPRLFPVDAMALRYANSLYTKAEKIRKSYLPLFSENDTVLIAVSGFPPGALSGDLEFFLRAVMPADNQVVHIPTNGQPLDPKVQRPTHSVKPSIMKPNGSEVLKQFLYPGDNFPFIDGVLFSEAANLQNLLGRGITPDVDGSNNMPHIFPNYSAPKDIPAEFSNNFFTHQFIVHPELVVLKEIPPANEIGE